MKGRETSVIMAIELFTLNLEFRGLSDEDDEDALLNPPDDEDEDDEDDADGVIEKDGSDEDVPGVGDEKLE